MCAPWGAARASGERSARPIACGSLCPRRGGQRWLRPKHHPRVFTFQGWRLFYIDNHRKMAPGLSSLIKFVEECSQNESLEVGYHLKALGELCSMEAGFKDVQLFLFARNNSMFLNLIGLHYSILSLKIPHDDVIEAIQSHHIEERQVCVNWFKLGRWFYGFHLPDESVLARSPSESSQHRKIHQRSRRSRIRVMAAKPGSSQWEPSFNWLLEDIAIAIASRLEVWDVCSLGSCSRFWRALCASDCLWLALSRKRWPALASAEASSSCFQGWRLFYVNNHRKMAAGLSSLIKFVEECSQNESLEVGYHLKALGELRSMEAGFKDVQLFLFARNSSVFLNLIGLHYSILSLEIPHNDVMEALQNHNIAERQVCVNWFKLGRWFYGFRLPDESRSRKVTLRELTTSKGEPILAVLNRGAVHEVLRVQITELT
ncbi:hypothetical protein J5N97_015207 [Dioscorea zingiberensis]|uniref:F-box domain-containing protein n=1 Tax=Dioscorea zingiberensis TaxID=325984 RepID=A0A9D5CWM1_9LILI|nr:hypothetical protein J5N97_015207 [Dioscorea zingiberensis]